MSTIRIKPICVASHGGFDICGRSTTRQDVTRRLYLSIPFNAQGDVYVYHMQKFNKKTVRTPVLTPAGKPSKKAPKITVIPTHWTFKVFKIPAIIVQMLKMDGKKIVQHKHHWSIDSIEKP
jgi:hypothetical protein